MTAPGAPAPAAPVALYVHVPFCRSLCPYCDFVVVAGAAASGPRSRVARFRRAVAVELALVADVLDAAFDEPGTPSHPALETIYLGGGTPSLLPAEAVAELLGIVERRFGIAPGAEVTLEANPGPDDRGDLAAMARAGITRISIGAQSLQAGELRSLGRRHHPSDIADTVVAARAAGIASVSLDLLYDVPGQTLASWSETLEHTLALEPDHISAYALTLDDPDAEGLTGQSGDHLPTTPGARRWRDAARKAQDEDRAAGAYGLADALLEANGYAWYELSNWARPGHQSRHNLAYWERRPYAAIGPGAHSFDGATRHWNAAPLEAWMDSLDPRSAGAVPMLPPGGGEVIDAAAAEAERLFLGLRLARGIPRDAALGRIDELAWAAENGLIEDAPGERVRLTLRGRLLSNELFARLV
ncbi:MAG: coproporphyrinogen-III oxidase family protein [Candidatus Limnocylindrales bacterium]|nr:coproporphyrinogen-III oxidase family protein [Candidatus Limnocylindrales bacterium]